MVTITALSDFCLCTITISICFSFVKFIYKIQDSFKMSQYCFFFQISEAFYCICDDRFPRAVDELVNKSSYLPSRLTS